MVIHTHQSSLFDLSGENALPCPQIDYRERWLTGQKSLFEKMRDTLTWNTRFRSRATVSFGVSYTKAAGFTRKRPFPDYLQDIANQIEADLGYLPNNCLANYYPTGDHYISFHSDQDMDMQAHSGVAIVSLGSTRQMELRKIDNHRLRYAYPLAPGSLFYMEDALQKDWQHGILTQKNSGARISLSFRALKEAPDLSESG